MWNRKELKEKAKKVIKKNYWTIIIVCFIMSILTGEYGLSSPVIERNFESADITSEIQQELVKKNILPSIENSPEESDNNSKDIDEKDSDEKDSKSINNVSSTFADSINSSVNSAVRAQKYIYKIVDGIVKLYDHAEMEAVILFSAALMAFLLLVLIADPLIVGEKRFFIKARKNSKTKLGTIVSIFKKGQWANIAKTMLLKNVLMFIWIIVIIIGFLLCASSVWVQYLNLTEYIKGIISATGVILGLVVIALGCIFYIIKSYQYRMIPYLLAENPHLKEKEIFKLTKQMMYKNKWKTFVLDLSFFLWYVLSILTLGLAALFYVNPYTEATKAELYAKLRNEAVKKKYEYYEKLVEAKKQEKTKESKKKVQ